MSRARKKIVATALACALAIGGLVSAPPQVSAAVPSTTPDTGSANDGVDYAALTAAGNGIYYGAYDHKGPTNGTETPVLWRVMGEESGENTLTLLSEYVLDDHVFNSNYYGGNAQNYVDSKLNAWLNGTFLSNSFIGSESDRIKSTDVITRIYDYTNGNVIEGNHWPQHAYTNSGDYKSDNQNDKDVDTGPWPKTATGIKIYIPWGYVKDLGLGDWRNEVYVDAANVLDNPLMLDSTKNSSEYPGHQATLKNGSSVYWWLRSPGSDDSSSAWCVFPGGALLNLGVNLALGVRPAFKLNLDSVLFTSEIVSSGGDGMGGINADSVNYSAAAGGARNFKLTILNNGIGSLGDAPTAQQNIAVGDNFPLENLTASADNGDNLSGGADYDAHTINYKIVDSGRDIVSSGKTTGPLAATGNSLTLDTDSLAVGSYDVYVWLQKNNQIHSFEGTNPTHFTLNVLDTTSPTVDSVSPSGGGAEVSGNIIITFSESMKSGVGSVSLDGGSTALSGGSWSTDANANDTYTIGYSGLAWDTDYTVTIRDFQDAAGNAMTPNPDDTHSFKTRVRPTGPDVSPTTLPDIEVGGTTTFTVSLGQSGNMAARADITNENPGIAVATPTSLTSNDTVTVEGMSAGDASFTVEFSGRDLATPTQIPVTVTVKPKQEVYHTIRASAGNGGSIDPSGAVSVKDGGEQTFAISANPNYRVANVVVDGVSVGAVPSHTFYNVTGDHTIAAAFAYDGGYVQPSRDRSSDSDSGSTRTWTPLATTYTIDAAEMRSLIATADKNGWDYARSSNALPTIVKAEAWKLLGSKKFVARTTVDKAVQVQLTFPEPTKLTTDMQVSGYTKGSIVDSRRAFFEKWFSNNLRIIHLEHTGSFGQAVEIAAKVDLNGMDTDNLYIYRYDKATNSYTLLCKPGQTPAEYWIDGNGYLHFYTDKGGDFVVCDGPLARK